ncbi:uncharacterized protein LOC109792654 [Cajanus cajan]|uniref:uncharacterized protein LOC109792654 n=1 Tax=Cajanus cajan TaxID=3821 RepID=UPI00098D9A2B|nr:uncharacterized protein LOC109792654 [Cajanus cajan]
MISWYYSGRSKSSHLGTISQVWLQSDKQLSGVRNTSRRAKVSSRSRSAKSELKQRLKTHGRAAQRDIPSQGCSSATETLYSPSLDDKVVSDSEEQGWMTGIWNYLKAGVLLEDKDEARKMRVRSAKFVIVRDELFKRGISTLLLKCLTEPQAAYVVEEIHRGICGMHSGARSMATRVLQAGYYWHTLKSDC